MDEPEIHHLATPRTARVLVQGSAEAPEVWFALHGYAELADDFLVALGPLAGPHRRLVVPEGLSRFYRRGGQGPVGASWMTSRERESEIADQLRYLDGVARSFGVGARRRVVLGFSQGAAAAARWCARGETALDRLILWGSEVPPDLDLGAAAERLRRAAPILVVGRRDAWFHAERQARVEARLREAQIPHRWVRYEGGHAIDPETLRALAEAEAGSAPDPEPSSGS